MTASSFFLEGYVLNVMYVLGDYENGYPGYGISLSDGTMKLQADMAADEAFICWDETGVGPSRVTWMYGWGTLDAYTDANYNAEFEEDWVACKHGLSFLRNANTSKREGTYIQLPAAAAPCTLNVWVGATKGSYSASLKAIARPVVDGVVGEAVTLVDTDDYTAKRYRKVSYDYTGEGNVAFRIGCDGYEVYLMYITIESGDNAGIANITVDANANAPLYNLQGMKVDSSYKGIVIQNGKKLINN